MSFKRSLLASAALTAIMATPAVYAQQIASSVFGSVTSPDGAAVSGTSVVITDTRTGSIRTVTTSSNGSFSARNLPVGGPYTLRVEGGEYEDFLVTDIYLDVAGRSTFPITLSAADASIEEIRVTAATSDFAFTALGPSTSFSQAEIRNLPSISRDINDIIRVDPRVNFQGGGVSCLGANNNFNAFTIDGVRAGDPFGLNGTGNLGRNTFPIPFDSVGSASVEFSPIDVQYGQFQGCQINVISQSGTNEFHGSAFFLYNNQDLQGDSVDGQDITVLPFDRFNWGADLGGPIIKDKLFFYVSYEEFSDSEIQTDGPAFLGFANGLPDWDEFGFGQSDLDRFANILANSYGRDPELLVPVFNNPETNRRFFGRIDWNINENHRLEATYARIDESNQESDDLDDDVFTFKDNFEVEGTKSDTVRVGLFSDWTDRFSTEIRVSRQEVTDVQGPIGMGEAQSDNPIARISVGQPGFQPNNIFFGQSFISGPGIFRSANQLNTQLDQIKVAGFYDADDHQITFGYELDSLNVFNLFIVNGTGTIFFDDLDALEAGTASGFSGEGSFTGNPSDAAAEFTRDIHSLYIQDNWQLTEDLEVIAGLRYDWYSSGDSPRNNPTFQQRYGFSNTQSFEGLDIWMPRIGLNWQAPEDIFGQTTFRAGVGVFSVAGPTVWFANSYQNFGGAIGQSNGALCAPEDFNVLQGGTFTGLPQCVTQEQIEQASGFNGRVDAVDPNFQLPSQTRINFGFSHFTDTGIDFFDGWEIQTDFIYSISNNAVDYVDLTLSPTGITPDGRSTFTAINPDLDGCNAIFQGPRVGFANVTDECNAGGDDQDILLTNTDGSGGRTINVTFQANKRFELTDVTTLDVNLGYAFTDVTLVNTGQNSTATTGYENTVTIQPNLVPLAPAVFQNAHNIVIQTTLAHDFFEDLTTSLGIFFSASEGSPFSFVFDDRSAANVFGDSDREARALPYIPTGPSDPLVDLSGVDSDAFFAFINENGLDQFAGGIAPRNVFRNPWVADIDLRLQQELPGFMNNDKFTVFLDVENFLNLLGGGVNRERNFGDVPEGVPFVRAALNDQGQYVYSNFRDPGFDINLAPTLWRLNLGIRYDF